VDRSCGAKKIPGALRSAGLRVIAHHEKFAADARDADILTACGRSNWVYVSQDTAVRKNPAELRALNDARIHAIFLYGRRHPAEYVINNLIAALPHVLRMLADALDPLHIVVMAGGKIRVMNGSDASRAP